jgi:hypothetical protein
MKKLNLFYEEPEVDRWLPFDRFPRRAVRRIVRGKQSPGGMQRYYLNLRAGLDRLQVPYRVNDYRYAQQHPDEVACIVGKPHVLDKTEWKNPILFGPAVFSHPLDDPSLRERLPVRRVLLSCEWFKDMFATRWDNNLRVWPSGINTYEWTTAPVAQKDVDVLLYDKVRWEYERYESELIAPLRASLERKGLKVEAIRYGYYKEEDFQALVKRSRAMLFLCEHETQGFAYLQTLASGLPILAWERGGFWKDPAYYPDKVQFAGVSAVPYWDERCGLKFKDAEDFPCKLDEFWEKLLGGEFAPREYVLENLTLEKCAQDYVKHVQDVSA